MTGNALMRPQQGPMAPWTNVPPAMSGYQVQGTSVLPYGLYKMPDGSMQSSYGLPQPMLDAYRSMRYGLGYEQDPGAPKGFVSQEAIQQGANGLSVGAMSGALPAASANALIRGAPAATLGSGPISNTFGSIRSLIARQMEQAASKRAAEHRKAVEEAAKLRQEMTATNQLHPGVYSKDPAHYLKEQFDMGTSLEDIARQTGRSIEDIVNSIRGMGDAPKEYAKTANQHAKTLKRGDKAKEKLGKEGEQIETIITRKDEVPPKALEFDAKEPKPKRQNMSEKEKADFWEFWEKRADEGGELPAPGDRKAMRAARKEMLDAGVDVDAKKTRTRLNKLDPIVKDGRSVGDAIRYAGPKGTNTLPAAPGGIPLEGSTSGVPDQWDDQNSSGVAGYDEEED